MYYSSPLESNTDSSLLKIICQVKKGKEKEKKTLVTGINFIKVFASDVIENSINLTIYDANNMTCAMVYFVVKAMRYIVDYVDLFIDPRHSQKSFEGTILVPPNVDISYMTESTKLAVHLIAALARSRKSSREPIEKKQAFSLLEIGMTPYSLRSLEEFLLGNSKFKIEEENIRALSIPEKSMSISLRYLKGK